ncbi:MAG: SUMF1/EgtB/PvdO family nonheme iron enzyme [Anaerolineales bacterium]|nr:SUMF1/EgtB/PvdO family nonheme iron enzyme [Anaerolineales bacterium]
MKKLFFVLTALAFISTGCQIGPGNAAQPTPISVATAFPTATPVALNPTVPPSDEKVDAGSERTHPVDGMTQVYIPEGTFWMGGLDANREVDESPEHQVTLHAYWMDKFEVTNGMYRACGAAGVCSPTQYPKSETRDSYVNNPEFNDYPVVYVTWQDAANYCQWVGRRLPTEAEWEYAARGATFNTYPWGDEAPDSSRANFNYQMGDTNRVGSYPAGASPFGILDMAGNVAEWVNDYYDSNYYEKGVGMNPTGPIARSSYFNRVVRGGSFGDAARNIRVSQRSSTLGNDTSAETGTEAYKGSYSPNIGFRCVSDY